MRGAAALEKAPSVRTLREKKAAIVRVAEGQLVLRWYRRVAVMQEIRMDWVLSHPRTAPRQAGGSASWPLSRNCPDDRRSTVTCPLPGLSQTCLDRPYRDALRHEYPLTSPSISSPRLSPQTIGSPSRHLAAPSPSPTLRRLGPIGTTRTDSTHHPKIAMAPTEPNQRQPKPTIRLYPQSPRRFASLLPSGLERKLDPGADPATALYFLPRGSEPTPSEGSERWHCWADHAAACQDPLSTTCGPQARR
jgi:hypothetical protein